MRVLEKFSLKDRVIIVTGGAGLLGGQFVQTICEAGGVPIVLDICESSLSQISEKISVYRHEVHLCDISNFKNIESVLNKILNSHTTIYGLINNAAINPKMESNNGVEFTRFETYSSQQLIQEVNIGLLGATYCTQIFGTHMAKNNRGVILNVSSDLGIIAPNQSIYADANKDWAKQPVKPVGYSIIKHGLIGLTKYTATYWGDQGVRCNAIAPGGVFNHQESGFVNKLSKLIPMNRMANIDEYNAAILFMLTDASSYMNGAVLSIDGGRTAW